MTPPILFFAYGNPARGDDALGPLLAEQLASWVRQHQWQDQIDVLSDIRPRPEHATVLADRALVIFAQASAQIAEPCCWKIIAPTEAQEWLSHAKPAAQRPSGSYTLLGHSPKECYLLCLHGNTFEAAAPLSDIAQHALAEGWQQLQDFLASRQYAFSN